mmetsp:Transcript_27062/g.75629  ORF Transcript_27062/g.75629 Transcript_27062/m.75629 type:complete len:200 (-) Transcript_27062:565-1164(-)
MQLHGMLAEQEYYAVRGGIHAASKQGQTYDGGPQDGHAVDGYQHGRPVQETVCLEFYEHQHPRHHANSHARECVHEACDPHAEGFAKILAEPIQFSEAIHCFQVLQIQHAQGADLWGQTRLHLAVAGSRGQERRDRLDDDEAPVHIADADEDEARAGDRVEQHGRKEKHDLQGGLPVAPPEGLAAHDAPQARQHGGDQG